MKYDRQGKMKQLFIERKEISCQELGDIFGISLETVRRDLQQLEDEGVVCRTYGGAVLTNNASKPNYMQPWLSRIDKNKTEKEKIAAEVVKHIENK